jgi:hypothetical protein
VRDSAVLDHEQRVGRSGACPVNEGVPPPANSKLAKVQLGMSKKQVTDVLGQPTDENSYATGKMWIPFYFGNDVRRTSFYYKGMGRVVFADGKRIPAAALPRSSASTTIPKRPACARAE